MPSQSMIYSCNARMVHTQILISIISHTNRIKGKKRKKKHMSISIDAKERVFTKLNTPFYGKI